MPRKLPKYCVEDVDRYGNVRIYLRRNGLPKVRLEGTPWAPAFMAAYEAAMAVDAPEPKQGGVGAAQGSWRWLCQQYFGSVAFGGLDAATRARRRASLEATFVEPLKPGSDRTYADFPIERMTTVAIRVLRDRKAATPEGANNRLKAIRGVFKWATSKEIELVATNPARDVGKIIVATDGHHTWSITEVKQYIKRHPKGTKAYLALCLLLFAGGRRSDVVLFGPQHFEGGWLRYTQHKGRNKNPMTLEVPVLPVLAAAISATPVIGTTAFLVTHAGKPFTSNGFGNWLKDRCVEAGLPHCSAHGLRKAGATIAAENGATVKQLMAMFGWRTSQMAELYTKKAEQKRLAHGGMAFIDFERTGDLLLK